MTSIACLALLSLLLVACSHDSAQRSAPSRDTVGQADSLVAVRNLRPVPKFVRADTMGDHAAIDTVRVLRIVAALVRADTMGDHATIDSLIDWRSCDTDIGADYIAVTVGAEVLPLRVVLDTIVVRVQYRVLGSLWAEDSHMVGDLNGRFVADPRADTLTLFVSRGAPYHILCDQYRLNHVSISRLASERKGLNLRSRAALDSALRRKGR